MPGLTELSKLKQIQFSVFSQLKTPTIFSNQLGHKQQNVASIAKAQVHRMAWTGCSTPRKEAGPVLKVGKTKLQYQALAMKRPQAGLSPFCIMSLFTHFSLEERMPFSLIISNPYFPSPNFSLRSFLKYSQRSLLPLS